MEASVIEAAIARVKAGDSEAFREVVSETASLVRGYIGFFISDTAAIDDVSQSVYLEIYRQLDRYEAETNVVGWIKAIARNVALSERRQRERKQQAHRNYVDQLKSRLESAVMEGEKESPIEEQLARLHQCMSKLPERMQTAVKLHYQGKFSANRVAESIQSSTGAVLNLLYRARAALSRCMKAPGQAVAP